MTVEFFKHKYGHEIEGVWLPRVTAITSLLSRSFSFGSQAAANWGTRVHKGVELLMKGHGVEKDDISPSLDAFLGWQKENKMRAADPVKTVEAKVWDFDHGYAGTLDMVAIVGGRTGVLDLKTASIIRDEYAMQTAAYMGAYNKEAQKKLRAETRWILRLDQYKECRGCQARVKDRMRQGKAHGGNELCNHQWGPVVGEVEFVELPNFQEDLEAFLSAKEVWEWYYKGVLRRISNYPKNVIQKVLV